MMEERKKTGLLVGCNYANSGIPELKGSHNDVQRMRTTLINTFGFEADSIEVMMDCPEWSPSSRPTGARIMEALLRMAREALPGDVLFFHFSGHGTRFPKPGQPRILLEAIVPCDANLITGSDFKYVLSCIPEDTTLTIMCDSCNSGGLIGFTLDQIDPTGTRTRATASTRDQKTRFVEYELLVQQQLSPATGLSDRDIGVQLVKLFGAEASTVFRLNEREIGRALVGDEGILLVDEFSSDNENGYGEFSNAFVLGVVENGDVGGMSNRTVGQVVRNYLRMRDVGKQHPCLYCTHEKAHLAFLSPLEY